MQGRRFEKRRPCKLMSIVVQKLFFSGDFELYLIDANRIMITV